MDKSEREIEASFKARMEKAGCMVWKFVSPGNAGVPDRLILLPNGLVFFAEIKKFGAKPRPLQVAVHKKLMKQGFVVMVIDSENMILAAECYVRQMLGR